MKRKMKFSSTTVLLAVFCVLMAATILHSLWFTPESSTTPPRKDETQEVETRAAPVATEEMPPSTVRSPFARAKPRVPRSRGDTMTPDESSPDASRKCLKKTASANCFQARGKWATVSLLAAQKHRSSSSVEAVMVSDNAKSDRFAAVVGRDACSYHCEMSANCTHALHWDEPHAPRRTTNISPQLQKELDELEAMGRAKGIQTQSTAIGDEGDTYQLFTVNLNATFLGSVCVLLSQEFDSEAQQLVGDENDDPATALLYTRSKEGAPQCLVIQDASRADALNELSAAANTGHSYSGCVSTSALHNLFTAKQSASLGNPGFDNAVFVEVPSATNATLHWCLLLCASSEGCIGLHVRENGARQSCVLRTVLNINAPPRNDDEPMAPLHTFELRFPFLPSRRRPTLNEAAAYRRNIEKATCNSAPALEHRSEGKRGSALFSCLSPTEVVSIYDRRPHRQVTQGSGPLLISSPLGLISSDVCMRWCLSFGAASCHDAKAERTRCTVHVSRDKIPVEGQSDEGACKPLLYDGGEVQEAARQLRLAEVSAVDDGVEQRKREREASEARLTMKESDVEDSIEKYRDGVARLSQRRGCVTDAEALNHFTFLEGYDYAREATLVTAAAHSKAECARLCLSFSWCVGGVMGRDGILCQLKSIAVSTLDFPSADRVIFTIAAKVRTSHKVKELEAGFAGAGKLPQQQDDQQAPPQAEDDGIVKVEEHSHAPQPQSGGEERANVNLRVVYGVSASHRAVKQRLQPMLSTWLKGEKAVVLFDTVDAKEKATLSELSTQNISAAFSEQPSGKDTAITNGNGAWKVFPLLRSMLSAHPSADFFVLVDDDAFVIKENLRELLLLHSNPKHALYMGRAIAFGPLMSSYVDGASGIILNAEAARRIGLALDVCEQNLFPFHFGDVRFGLCASFAGVSATQVENSFTNEPLERLASHHELFGDLELPTIVHQYRAAEQFFGTQAALDKLTKARKESGVTDSRPGISTKVLLNHYHLPR